MPTPNNMTAPGQSNLTEVPPDQAQLLLEYRAILENASAAILFTRNSKVLHCNNRFAEMFGWLSPEELRDQPGSAFWPTSEEYAEVGRKAGPTLASGRSYEVECPMRRKDGSLFLCHIVARAVNPAATTEGTIWIGEDVTDRRRAEEETRQLMLQQQAILENASVGILFTQEGGIRHCNARMEQMFGWGPGELIGQSARVFFASTEDYGMFGQKAGPVLLSGNQLDVEWNTVRKDGSRLWCRILARAVVPGDATHGTIWTTEDVSARREAQQALMHAHEELENRVAERTAELAATNLRLQEEIAERRQAEDRVMHLANHDALTGLPNRRLLIDRLGQALALAHRDRQHVAVLFMDLDRFKTINDSLGHMIGDALLQTVARRLSGALREGDTVSRLGGDEFVVVLPNLDHPKAAEKVALKLIEALAPPIELGGHELRVSASIGISLFPEDGNDTETLLRNADSAMYHAKDMGRNNYQFFLEQMNVTVAERLRLENDLHRALARQEFELHYQPRVSLANGAICGVEALIRWRHPERGLILPEHFIPVAEDTGLIVPIGEWVVRESCRQGKAWSTAGLPPIPVAINLSPRQFRQSDLVDTVSRALEQHGWPSSLLELEITEGVLMQQTSDTLKTLEALHRLGVGLAIDDFGTGYSSLSYLKRFPVDFLKIDRSFVRDIAVDPDDASIVTAIIGLAHSLGLTVVAEGVENAGQLAFIRDAGCDEAQGRHISHPIPADQLAAWVLANRPQQPVKNA
jgi:diguanylate cyclase (GGDEF)-like protein/PAS domain S-box-containing protein